MSHGLGVTEALTGVPDPVVVAFALVTQLGDVWFVVTAGALAYWLGSQAPVVGEGLTRDRAATVLALLGLAVALTVTLKTVVAHPRPPGAAATPETDVLPAATHGVYVWLATGEGHAFPSGHATVTPVVWGGFAWAVRVGSRRRRVAVAAAVSLLVGLSRLVLGVHYLPDVLAGFAVAGCTLWLALTRLRTPARVFGLGAGVALAGLALVGPTYELAAVVGLTVTGLVASVGLPTVPEPTRAGARATVALGVAVVGATLVATPGVPSTPLTVALLVAAGTGLLLALPLAGERVVKKASGVAA